MSTTLGPLPARDHGGFFSGRLQARNRPVVPAKEHLPVTDWLFRSQAASLVWLVARVWLGYEWADAGFQKIFGDERMGFWYNQGAAVKSYALSGVAASHGPHPAVAFGWWAGFLHNFVAPNAAWVAKLVALGELAIGVGLLLGLFTGIAALAAVTLNLAYILSGTAGVNPMYALVGVLLILAWRNAGTIGLDGFVLRAVGTPFHPGQVFRRPVHDHQPKAS